MRFITDVQDDAQFLGMVYDAVESVANLVNVTKMLDIRKNMPKLTGNETDAEVKEKLSAQSKKNFVDIARSVMKEHPEETVAAIHALIVLDDGEEYPKGFALLKTLLDIAEKPEIIDFFTSVARLSAKN